MDDTSTTTAALGRDQADEEILTYNVCDEALEAAAGADGQFRHLLPTRLTRAFPDLVCC